ncbi:MAG: metalloregulator ArsR/SmtB family transcription factor [Bacillota bacterium]
MIVYSGSEKEWNIEFIYSPLFELLCSLHVLIKPEHHLERLEWAEEMRKNIPPKLYSSIAELWKKTYEWCPLMDLCNIHEECDDFNVMAAINFIGDLPLESLKYVFSKYSENTGWVDKQLQFDMTALLKEYYLCCYERESRFVEPLLVRCLKKESEHCRSIGILNYVRKLHSRIEVTEEAFLFHKYKLYTIPFDNLKRIIVRISSFIDPHLLMDYGDGMVQFTIRVHLGMMAENVPRDLLKVVKALSDETRLKMLRIMYRGKATTQSLAQDLKLTEACISKHLKLLYDADILYKERSGSFIYYFINTSMIDRIPLGIYEYIS